LFDTRSEGSQSRVIDRAPNGSQFDRPAADVEHQHRPGLRVVPAAGGQVGQLGLTGAGQEPQLDAGFPGDVPDDLRRVGRVADRGRRERVDVADAVAVGRGHARRDGGRDGVDAAGAQAA
jgi:hypothetical protein